MKYSGSYFPFIVISLFLYGLFFYFNNKSPIDTNSQQNSAEQAIYMQLTSTEQTTPIDRVTTLQQIESRPSQEEIQVQQLNNVVAVEKNKLDAQKVAALLLAKERHRESIRNNDVSADAILKEQIFNDELIAAQIEAQRILAAKEAQIAKRKIAKANTPPAETSIASILPITEPVPEENSSVTQIIPKKAPLEETEEPVQISKPKFTKKSPPKEALTATLDTAEKRTAQKIIAPIATPQAVATNVVIEEAVIEAPITTVVVDEPQNNEQIASTEAKEKRTFKPKTVPKPIIATEAIKLQEAVVVSGNQPIYPEPAISEKKQGVVTVKMTVLMSGKTKDAEVIESSGDNLLDDEILRFVDTELFMPALKGEEKITSEQRFTHQFKLDKTAE
ncbi:TonB family protein [Psychromonas sp.]|nr:TonB family protein [Psychromonas sp.]